MSSARNRTELRTLAGVTAGTKATTDGGSLGTATLAKRTDKTTSPNSATANSAGQLRSMGVQFHKSGLSFTSRQSLSTWEQVGAGLLAFADSSTWWVADWLVFGESEFQDRYHEAIKRTSLSYQTLRNYTWVARKFPLTRRRQNLSFSHHLEVVALDQPEQDYWLRKAEELGWSRNKLRGEVRSSLRVRRGEVTEAESRAELDNVGATGVGSASGWVEPVATGSDSGPDRDDADRLSEAGLLHIELPAEILAQIQTAARKEGAPVETWATEILRRAAGES